MKREVDLLVNAKARKITTLNGIKPSIMFVNVTEWVKH
jgi:hypothetical protein